MRKKLLIVFEVTVALVALAVGYTFVTGTVPGISPAAARSATMPANPHILYLAPVGTQRGAINDAVMEAKGATLSRSWRSARSAARNRPLDALLIDDAYFEQMSNADQEWLQGQFRDGVVIVGLGVEDEEMAPSLGLNTLRVPTEAPVPIGPIGYKLVEAMILGQPEDIKIAEENNWLEKAISGEGDPLEGIKYPLLRSSGSARGELNSIEDIDALFHNIRSRIEGAYRMRLEYEKVKQIRDWQLTKLPVFIFPKYAGQLTISLQRMAQSWFNDNAGFYSGWFRQRS